MEIRPADLGTKWHIAMVRYRALGTARFTLPPKQGTLGKLWASGLNLPENIAATTLPLLSDMTLPLVAGVGTGIVLTAFVICFFAGFAPLVVLGNLIVAGAGLYAALYALPRRAFHRLHTSPIRSEELEALKGARPKRVEKTVDPPRQTKNPLLKVVDGLRGSSPRLPGDELESVFLTFVQDALAVRGLSVTAEAEIRRVILTLGEAVSALPDPMTENDTVSDIVGDAENLTEQARREQDTVVAQSLLRQAEAHLTRAHALDNNRKLLRRTQVLRDELIAQIRAVRTLLPTLGDDSITAATDFSRLVGVAATVQSIASEATSVAEARQELSLALYPRLEPVESRQQAVGIRE